MVLCRLTSIFVFLSREPTSGDMIQIALPGLTPDLLIPLGIGDNAPLDYVPRSPGSCSFAVSLGVAPHAETTIGAIQGNADGIEPTGCGPTVVIDGATPRPVNT